MLKHLLGWKTNRKIIVFESDDWGSFRFKNKAIRDAYIQKFDPRLWMHNNDAFESYEDLVALESVLKSVNDKNENTACFTFLFNPANPDFKKIEESDFTAYYYETFLETLQERNDGEQIKKWYASALATNLIEIGFHGREHLNISLWLKHLRAGDEVALKSFKDRVWGLSKMYEPNVKSSYRAAFDMQSMEELPFLGNSIREGIDIINSTFQQKTSYFLPPNGPYHLKLNSILVEKGIQYIGLAKMHQNPLETKTIEKKLFWLGKKTKENLSVITRNVVFEPASPDYKGVEGSLKQIERAFNFKNPAVISTHRANYIGSLNPENRSKSLEELKCFLFQIKSKWPEVEFVTSSTLGKMIAS